MDKVQINNQEYLINSLSEQAKVNLQMYLHADSEIKRLQAQLAITQTAKNVYANALTQAVVTVPQGDTIKL
jgi:hypothetical protein